MMSLAFWTSGTILWFPYFYLFEHMLKSRNMIHVQIMTLFWKSTDLNSCIYDVLIPKREHFGSNLEQDYKFLSLMQSKWGTESMPSSAECFFFFFFTPLNSSYMWFVLDFLGGVREISWKWSTHPKLYHYVKYKHIIIRRERNIQSWRNTSWYLSIIVIIPFTFWREKDFEVFEIW